MTFALHYVIGLASAGIGWWARGFCRHNHHRVMLTLSLIAVETFAAISIVG